MQRRYFLIIAQDNTNTNAFLWANTELIWTEDNGGNSALNTKSRSTIKEVFSGSGQFTYDGNQCEVSMARCCGQPGENTNPSFDFGTTLLKNTNKLAYHSRLAVLRIDYRDEILLGRIQY
jgi:hypothetical protein